MALTLHGNNGVITTNGTAAAPSIAAPDNDTGFFFDTNTIKATTSGSERLRIGSTGISTFLGNVDIAHGTGQAHYQITQTNGNTVKMGIVSGSDFEISGSSNNNIIFKRAGSTRLTITTDGATVAPNLTANSVLSSYGGIQTKLGYISGGAEGFTGTISNHSLFIKTNDTNRIKIANNSAATSIGGALTFNALLTTQGDISGGLLLLKAAENTNRFFVSGNDSNGCEVNLYDGAGGQRGILGVSSGEFFIKAPNSSAPMNFYTHNGSSIGLRLKINSAGDILLGTDQATIGCNTADGSDNRSFSLCGGSDASQSRGSIITFYGNEANNGHSQYGTLSLKSGNTNSGFIDFWTQGAKKAEITKDGVFRIQSTYNGSAHSSNAYPCLNITNLQGTYTANNILGGVTFGKAAGHSNGVRAGMLAIYQGNGSNAGNVGAHLSFWTSANGAGDGNEKLFISDTGVLCTGNYRGLLDQTMGSIQVNGGSSGGRLGFRGTTTNAYGGLGEIHGYWGTNKVASILFHAGTRTGSGQLDDGEIRMYTRPVGGGGTERLRITSEGKFVMRSQGATASDGYAALEIRQNTGGKHLVLATNSATSSTNEVMLGFKLHPSGQDERVKAAIVCRGTGSNDYGQPQFMSFCLDNVGDNGNATVANDEKLRIASDGEVFIGQGFGDTNRSTLLSISGAYQDPTGVWTQVGIYSSDSYAQNKGGSIGFGGHDGSTAKQQFAAIKGAKEDGNSGNYKGYLAFYTRPDGAVTKERWRITSDGQLNSETNGGMNIHGGNQHHSNDGVLYVDKSGNSDWALKVNAASASSTDYCSTFLTNNSASYAIAVYDLNNSSYRMRVNGNGVLYSTNTSVQSISDRRLKENIVDANSQWDDIKGLKFRNYKWKADSGYADGKTYLGLIADEVESVCPNLTSIDAQPKEDIEAGKPDPEYKAVNYSIVWMKAVKALQEAQSRIETLEAEVAALKGS